MKQPNFAERHPYWFMAILEVVVILAYLIAGTIAYFVKASDLGLYGLANFGLTLITVVMLTRMKWWRKAGFRAPDERRDLGYFLVPLIPMVWNLIPGVEVTSLRHVLELLIITLMVGFVEETIFRGLMLQVLKVRGPWKAVLISALLFGLTHAMNALAGASIAENVSQIFYAVAIGFAYAALALKKGILWPLVLAHFLIDFVYFIQKPGFTYGPSLEMLIVVGTAVVMTAYGVFVMLQEGIHDTVSA